jgi:vanillate O-demethylase ferredoxin subunit
MSFAFAASTREVLEQVVRQPRFRELTTIPKFALQEIGLIIAVWGVFAASTTLYLQGTLPWALMIPINAAAIYASFTPLHDATHRTVSGSRFLNDLLGTISCLLLLPGVTTGVYRYLHLEHHRHTGNPEKDPDDLMVTWIPAIFFIEGWWFFWYVRHWSTRPARERLEFTLGISTYVLIYVVGLATHPTAFLLCWAIPQRIGFTVLGYLFAHIQHPEGVTWEAAPFQTTVRVTMSPWTSWTLIGQANHAIHHLAPSVPYYRYHHAWKTGERLFQTQRIPTRTLFRPTRDLVLPQPEKSLWLEARVRSVTEVAKDVRSYELVPADATVWPSSSAGAHIDVEVDPKHVRQYSLCNRPGEPGIYRIAVRRDERGRGGSKALHDRVKPGDTIRISPPRNRFPLSMSFDEYVLVAGGIGITPLLAMAHELHAAGKEFTLHLCARTIEALPFRDEIPDLPFADRVVVHLDDGKPRGRLVPETDLGTHRPGRAIYLCGPSGFMSWTAKAAEDLSWPAAVLFSESFVPPRLDPSQNKRFEVVLAKSGTVLTVEPDQFLIDVLHANGCMVMCSCTQGICGSCLTPVVDGVPDHRDAILTDVERESNRQMTVCVSRAKSERLVLDL